jgi:hypothetical protein
MPSDGAVTLADVRAPTLSIVCARCGRYGRYAVKRLIALHGAVRPARIGRDAKLPDLLATLANCDKARSVSIHDRCQARYDAGFRRRV